LSNYYYVCQLLNANSEAANRMIIKMLKIVRIIREIS
jgi:hypothetical protein